MEVLDSHFELFHSHFQGQDYCYEQTMRDSLFVQGVGNLSRYITNISGGLDIICNNRIDNSTTIPVRFFLALTPTTYTRYDSDTTGTEYNTIVDVLQSTAATIINALRFISV